MSATIVQLQKSSTNVGNSHYFECGDLFQTVDQQSQQQQHQQPEIGLDAGSSMMLLPEKDLHQHNQMQQQQGYRLHGALTRTISQPAQAQAQAQAQSRQPLQFVGEQQQQQQQQQQVASLVTIIENLGSMNLHRKLERTQSEPLPPQQPMNTSRYKTELCRPFEEAGECKYGEKCQFAHGYHELRNLQRHPKYKTEPCRTFHSKGLCPYGPRCHFVHNADEARASQQQHQHQQQQQQSSNSKQINNNNNNNNNNSSSQGGVNGMNQFFLPLSPPLSMSTGSDRESPTGSLSLSPTNSLTNFPFSEAKQQQQSNFFMSLGGASTPPESPHAPISPVHTPPPYGGSSSSSKTLEFHHHPASSGNSSHSTSNSSCNGGESGKQLLQKSISSPLHIMQAVAPQSGNGNGETEAPRLPVFNRLSSAVDACQLPSNLGL